MPRTAAGNKSIMHLRSSRATPPRPLQASASDPTHEGEGDDLPEERGMRKRRKVGQNQDKDVVSGIPAPSAARKRPRASEDEGDTDQGDDGAAEASGSSFPAPAGNSSGKPPLVGAGNALVGTPRRAGLRSQGSTQLPQAAPVAAAAEDEWKAARSPPCTPARRTAPDDGELLVMSCPRTNAAARRSKVSLRKVPEPINWHAKELEIQQALGGDPAATLR